MRCGGVFWNRIPAAFAVAVVACAMVPADAAAQTRNEGADTARKEAEAKAESKLGYPDVYDLFVGGSNAPVDYHALSRQIARMAAFIEAFGQSMRSVVPSGLPGPGAPGAGAAPDVTAVYGPDGATAKSVRVFLEYRLMVAGNPRLTVGKVTEDDNRVYAQVVTRDGALVEEYAIDKKTGAWTPRR